MPKRVVGLIAFSTDVNEWETDEQALQRVADDIERIHKGRAMAYSMDLQLLPKTCSIKGEDSNE